MSVRHYATLLRLNFGWWWTGTNSQSSTLTDVTLADEDTNSIPTDNVNRAIQGNVAMHVPQPRGQLWIQCK